MKTLIDVCDIVDNFISHGTSSQIENACEFWKLLNDDSATAQLYTECLIYKYIALCYGLASIPLYQALSQIRNISSPKDFPGVSEVGSSSPATSPRGCIAQSGKTKSSSGNFDSNVAEPKTTSKKKFNIVRRKSEDGKKSKKELSVDNSDFWRKSKLSAKPSLSPEAAEKKEENSPDTCSAELNNVLLSLTYIAKMYDLTRWDFTKLREVFLAWNKARGWEQTASNYEYTVMKNFSMSPPVNTSSEDQLIKSVSEVLQSMNKIPDECSVADDRNVGESIKYWEVRHKILTRPEEAVSVIKCLVLTAKKILGGGNETKVLPLLHVLCETVLMSPHTPPELLQECYTTFEQFYIWPSYVAHPVKEVLEMIQLEMKCPGHFYRMILLQDNEISLPPSLAAKMPSSETHVFIDENIPDSEALSEAFRELRGTRASASKATAGSGIFRFVLRHIFESVFGSGCCDLSTLERALQSIPGEDARGLCNEALSIMEEASTKETYGQAHDFLRAELETFSDKLTGYLEGHADGEVGNAGNDKSKPPGCRRVSVLYDSCRTQNVTTSPTRSFSGGNLEPLSPLRGNSHSHLRRTTSGGLDSPMGSWRLKSRVEALAKETPAELIGSKVSTVVFNHADLSDTVFELVRNTSKEYVQEKKKSSRYSSKRKKDSKHLDDRDSGVIDDEDPTVVTARNLANGAMQHLRIDETEEEEAAKIREDVVRLPLSATPSTESSSSHDSEGIWKEFLEKGFDSDNDELVGLLKAMTFEQRKSFIMETNLKLPPGVSTSDESSKSANVPTTQIPPSVAVAAEFAEADVERPRTLERINAVIEPDSVLMRSQSSKREHRKLHRLSRFMRSRGRSGKKGLSEGDLAKLSSAESLSSVSSAPSSTTSDETSDSQSLRVRTASDPVFRQRKRGKWSRTVGPSSSPLVAKSKRGRLNVDVTPRSPFNSSVRSLPGNNRASLFGADIFGEHTPLTGNEAADCDKYRSPKRSYLHPYLSTHQQDAFSPISLTKPSFHLGGEDEDESRSRIDSGIGPENVQDLARRRTSLAYSSHRESEDHGIGGVEFALKEVKRRNRMWVSDDLESRTVYKKVLKLVFVGNDKTIGHVARAYYNLRKRQMSRAPLLQHVDLRLFFIPVSSMNSLDKGDDALSGQSLDSCDIRVGELLGTYDSWYHTVVTLSVNNLLRVFPKICAGDEKKSDSSDPPTPEKQTPERKVLAPQEVIASALLSYCRFAVSRTDLCMYQAVMVTSTGDVITDVFCCQLKIGHEAYTTAVKAGRFGKLGKLVDLSNDSGPPPAYTRIEYSKWSIDGRLIYTGQMPDTFYHTVCVTPLCLHKNHFRGTYELELALIDNVKREKAVRRTSSAKVSLLEEADIAGSLLDIGTMKMEVVRPTQGTFSLILDDSKIYTSIKSIEIVPCGAPEAEHTRNRGRNVPRHLRDQQLIRLPLRTFWPVNQ